VTRGLGRVRACSPAQAKDRMTDAEAFLRVSDGVADDPDVIATNAIHAAIAAADVICCLALQERAAGQDHGQAVDLLGLVDKKLAAALGRALDFKSQAAYDDRSVSDSDAARVVTYARRIVEAARDYMRDLPQKSG
jgi:hypothetical protein